MTECFFCGSHIERMKNEKFFRDKPHIKLDRYFVDKRDNKKMCKLCGMHYIERQFMDLSPQNEELDTGKFLQFIIANFDKVMI